MRTLFLTPVAPFPPASGGQKATLALLKAYARAGEVHLAGFYDPALFPQRGQIVEGLEPYCARIDLLDKQIHFGKHRIRHVALGARSLLGSVPFRIRKFRDPRLTRIITGLRPADYDLVHCDFLHMASYLSRLSQLPAVVAEHNVEFEIFERHATFNQNPLIRAFAAVEARRLRAYEVETLNSARHVFVLSGRDQDVLARGGVTTDMTVLPFPADEIFDRHYEDSRMSVVSLGNLDAPGRMQGTKWFAGQVWPQVKSCVPEATWHVVGAGGGRSIEALRHLPGVNVHGFASAARLREILMEARVCVVPLFIGGGIRIKIIDMLAAGIPCVATEVGAQGFEGAGIAPTDDPREFGRRVCELLTRPQSWEAASSLGKRYVDRHHSAQALWERFAPVIGQVLGRTERTAGS